MSLALSPQSFHLGDIQVDEYVYSITAPRTNIRSFVLDGELKGMESEVNAVVC